jgi:hypothetical protein
VGRQGTHRASGVAHRHADGVTDQKRRRHRPSPGDPDDDNHGAAEEQDYELKATESVSFHNPLREGVSRNHHSKSEVARPGAACPEVRDG